MPVIVIGADTPQGMAILDALLEPDREVRAFVSDPETSLRLRSRGVKVAIGDLSDRSHVEAACMNCFSAVLVAEAASDGRELAFAREAGAVLRGWAGAVAAAGVQRSIWVVEGEAPSTSTPESATVASAGAIEAVAARVAELDDIASLS